MAIELVGASFKFTGSSSIVDPDQINHVPVDSVEVGASGFPTELIDYTVGTDVLQADMSWFAAITIPAGGNYDIDFDGGLTPRLGNTPIVWSQIKSVNIAVDTPDGTKEVMVGPQGVASGIQLWFGDTGATSWESVKTWRYWEEPYNGWNALGSEGTILRLHNPGAADIIVHIIIVGIQV